MRKAARFYSKFKTEFLPWGGFVLGALGTLIAIASYLASKETVQKAQDIEAQQYFYQVMDLFGAEAREPRSLTVWLNPEDKADVKKYRQRLEEGRRLIERYSILKPNAPEIPHLRLLYYVLTHDPDGAKAELGKLIGAGNAYSDSNLYTTIGFIVAQTLPQRDQALAFHQRAIALDPKNAFAYGAFGYTFHSMNRNDHAVAMFRSAVNLDPAKVEYRNGLAHVLSESDHMDEAEAVFRDTIARGIADGQTYNGIGVVLAYVGKNEEALENFTRATALSPSEARYHYNLALVLRRVNRLEDAKRQMKLAKHYSHAPEELKETGNPIGYLRFRLQPANAPR
jgi:tetratricopeptide (TPR) repeat protein